MSRPHSRRGGDLSEALSCCRPNIVVFGSLPDCPISDMSGQLEKILNDLNDGIKSSAENRASVEAHMKKQTMERAALVKAIDNVKAEEAKASPEADGEGAEDQEPDVSEGGAKEKSEGLLSAERALQEHDAAVEDENTTYLLIEAVKVSS